MNNFLILILISQLSTQFPNQKTPLWFIPDIHKVCKGSYYGIADDGSKWCCDGYPMQCAKQR